MNHDGVSAVAQVTEFHHDVKVEWRISVYSGTSVEDAKPIKSHSYETALITRSRDGPSGKCAPADFSISWLLGQVDAGESVSRFCVDTADEATKTPRRNNAVEGALDFASRLAGWCEDIGGRFFRPLDDLCRQHSPASSPSAAKKYSPGWWSRKGDGIFNPILPLMEERDPSGDEFGAVECKSTVGWSAAAHEHETILVPSDLSRLTNEHVRSLDETVAAAEKSPPWDGGVLSSTEGMGTLFVVSHHMPSLSVRYAQTMDYVESMMEEQLIAAIGKRLVSRDVDQFLRYHNARLLRPAPRPFARAVRRPGRHPGHR